MRVCGWAELGKGRWSWFDVRCRGGVTPSQPWKKSARAQPASWELDDKDSHSHSQQARATADTLFTAPSCHRTPPASFPPTGLRHHLLTRHHRTRPNRPSARTQPPQPATQTPLDRDTLMPGLLSPLSASGTGAVAGMKRPHEDVSVPTYGQPHPKKARVAHHLHHTQPVAQLVEPLGGGFGAADDQEFIHTQLRRAIAIQCKGIGFASARPEAIESLVGLVHECTVQSTSTTDFCASHIADC